MPKNVDCFCICWIWFYINKKVKFSSLQFLKKSFNLNHFFVIINHQQPANRKKNRTFWKFVIRSSLIDIIDVCFLCRLCNLSFVCCFFLTQILCVLLHAQQQQQKKNSKFFGKIQLLLLPAIPDFHEFLVFGFFVCLIFLFFVLCCCLSILLLLVGWSSLSSSTIIIILSAETLDS